MGTWAHGQHYWIATYAETLRQDGAVTHERDTGVAEQVGRHAGRTIYRLWLIDDAGTVTDGGLHSGLPA